MMVNMFSCSARSTRLKLLILLSGSALVLILTLVSSLSTRDAALAPSDVFERSDEQLKLHEDEFINVGMRKLGDINRKYEIIHSSMNIRDGESEAMRMSESVNIAERGKFQMEQIDKYCRDHKGHHGDKYDLPDSEDEKQLLYRHLLYDDTKKAMFCFVEKIGCTDMKRMWFVSVGELPLRTINDEWVDLKYLEKGIRRVSFLNKSLDDAARLDKIKHYFKFMIVRHPLERLVSGFRNKIEPPLTDMSVRFPNYIKLTILQKYRPREFEDWVESETSRRTNLTVTFEEFVLYFVNSNLKKINPHLKPVIYSCHPCRIRYEYYGNFKTYSQDALLAMEHLGIDSRFYRNKSLHSSLQQTSEFLEKYYGQLSSSLKYRLYKKLQEELEFYYTLFPRERNTHVDILGVAGS